MHRVPVLKLLDSHVALNEVEESNRIRTIDFVKQHTDCFERSCIPGHITGSSWLLNRLGTHVLLLHHRKLNIWVQPGGHCDGETDVLQSALREAQEETGITNIAPVSAKIFDVDIHRIPERPGEPAHDHYDIAFLLQVWDDSNFVGNEESLALKWFSQDDSTIPLNYPNIQRMHQKWKSLK